MPPAESERPVFYYDLTSPECWLAAEEVNAALPVVPVWQPVHLPAVLALAGVAAGGLPADDPGRQAEVERRAASGGLLAVRWPAPFPGEGEAAMRVATFAQGSGRVVAFSLAAFRQAFAAGRDLGELDTLLLAAAACELHPRAVLKGVESRSVRERAQRAHEEAANRGVAVVPVLRVGEHLFAGPSVVEDAAAHLSCRASA